jgi:hypothetical protein
MRILGILVLASTLMLTSCTEDFLSTPSLTQPAGDQPFKSANDVNLALNGVYSVLQSNTMYGGTLNGFQGYPGYDALGDNAFNQYKWEGLGLFMEGNLTPASGPVLSHWNDLYQGISRVNLVINKLQQVEGSDLSPDQVNAYLGQAYFLRALFYFNLAVYFEDAPLITEPQTIAESYVPKNTYEEITAQVVEDLTFASENLPISHPSELYGYATRGAALSLFARVQLYNGNYDGPNGVLELTNEVLGLGYSLHPNYAELFTPENETSPEVIFSVRFQRELGFSNGETFSATYLGTPKVDIRPMPNLVNSYYDINGQPVADVSALPTDQRDPRANATIFFEGDLFLEDINRFYGVPPVAKGPTGFATKKYIRKNESDEEGFRSFTAGSQDFYVIRYADVLLMRAEAMAETGDIAGATAMVNEVRARVGMPSVESVEGAVSQAEMIEIVRHERRVELALEGLRFMDLKRWGEIEEAFNRAIADPVGPYNPVYQGRKSEVLPIPQNELDVNPNLVQHPDW